MRPLLAVVADVDAGVHLLLHDMAHRLVHLGCQHLRVVGLAFLLRHQQVGQLLVARQAADMGGEDAVAAEDHAFTPHLSCSIAPTRLLLRMTSPQRCHSWASLSPTPGPMILRHHRHRLAFGLERRGVDDRVDLPVQLWTIGLGVPAGAARLIQNRWPAPG